MMNACARVQMLGSAPHKYALSAALKQNIAANKYFNIYCIATELHLSWLKDTLDRQSKLGTFMRAPDKR